MKMWAGLDLVLPNITMLMFAVYFYVLSFADIRNVYIEAKGLWWEYRKRAIIETVANLLLNIIFVYFWGIFGIILATIITFIGVNIIYGTTIIFKQYFGINSIRKYYSESIKWGIGTAVITVIVYFLSTYIVCDSIILLLLKGIAVAVLTILLEFLIYGRTETFKFYTSKIFRKIKKY
jgi:hypothetical protein